MEEIMKERDQLLYEREVKEEQLYMDFVMETRSQFNKITEQEFNEYKEDQKKK